MIDDALQVLPADVRAGRAMPPEMIRDLVEVAHLDESTLGGISTCLSKLSGLKAKESITETVRGCLGAADTERVKAIVRTLLSFEKSDIARVLSTVDEWRKSTPARSALFGDERYGNLEKNLGILIGDYPSVELTRKANRLLREVGNEIDSVAFFCDMRPVFDDQRQNVKGFVLLANMRLLYLSQDGNRHSCEMALTKSELEQLIDSGEKALSKMTVLESLIEEIGGSGRDTEPKK